MPTRKGSYWYKTKDGKWHYHKPGTPPATDYKAISQSKPKGEGGKGEGGFQKVDGDGKKDHKDQGNRESDSRRTGEKEETRKQQVSANQKLYEGIEGAKPGVVRQNAKLKAQYNTLAATTDLTTGEKTYADPAKAEALKARIDKLTPVAKEIRARRIAAGDDYKGTVYGGEGRAQSSTYGGTGTPPARPRQTNKELTKEIAGQMDLSKRRDPTQRPRQENPGGASGNEFPSPTGMQEGAARGSSLYDKARKRRGQRIRGR